MVYMLHWLKWEKIYINRYDKEQFLSALVMYAFLFEMSSQNVLLSDFNVLNRGTCTLVTRYVFH